MAAVPPSSEVNENNKVAISMGVLVVVIAIIITAVWCTNRVRLPDVVPLSLRNQRRREEDIYRKEMRHFVLDSLPVTKYNAKFQSNDQRSSKSYSLATRVYPRKSETELIVRDEKSLNTSSEGAPVH